MDLEKQLKIKKFLSSMLFTIVITAVIITIIIGIYGNKTAKQNKKEALLKSRYGSEQVSLLKEIFKDKQLTPEERKEKINKFVDAAIAEVRYKRELKQTSSIVYGNLVYDIYLASDKWGIRDEKQLAKIQSRLSEIARDEVELNMSRYLGEVGIKELKSSGDEMYKERLETIEDYLPEERKNEYAVMKDSLNSIFDMKPE